MPAPARARRLTVGIILLLGSGLACWLSARWGWHMAEVELQEQAVSRLSLYSSSLRGAISKYEYLPFILSEDPAVQTLLQTPDFTHNALQEYVSQKLQLASWQSGAALLYILNQSGTAVATSNHADPNSLLGQSFRYRPYFQEAISGRSGRYYAIGTTTRQPGYYISHPISFEERVLGVAVVKINLEEVQEDWESTQENVLVLDARGVIALSSRPDWRFHTLEPLTPTDLESIRRQRQYEGAPLSPLGSLNPQGWFSRTPLLQVSGTSAPGLPPPEDAQEFLIESQPLEELSWRLLYLTPVSPLNHRATEAALAALGVSLLLTALWLFQRERRAKMRSLQQAHDQLEQRVEERTRELQATQLELIQTGKLAALGQMSATVAHELNQPLTAMQTFVASTQLLLQKGKLETVGENLVRLAELIRNVSSIASQLKVFARKSDLSSAQASLNEVLQFTLSLFENRIPEEQVSLVLEGWEDEWSVPGDAQQLRQLFTNLVSNALDAMSASASRELQIRVQAAAADRVLIEFLDSGSGIEEADLIHLFEPFFTRKPGGQGLGLGLSIAYGIAQAHRGTIRASNRDSGGAAFILELPMNPQTHA